MSGIVKKLVLGIRNYGWLSTTLAAVMLAGFWTLIWLAVFFSSLFLLSGSSTTLYGLFIAMWLSTCVEAIIRWFENSRLAAQFSKPHENPATGDNADYSFLKAAFFIVVGIAVTFAFEFLFQRGWVEIPRINFSGIPLGESPGPSIKSWLKSLSQPATISLILICFLLRIFIYKRSGKHPA